LTLAPFALGCLAEVICCLTGDLVFEGTGAGGAYHSEKPKMPFGPL